MSHVRSSIIIPGDAPVLRFHCGVLPGTWRRVARRYDSSCATSPRWSAVTRRQPPCSAWTSRARNGVLSADAASTSSSPSAPSCSSDRPYRVRLETPSESCSLKWLPPLTIRTGFWCSPENWWTQIFLVNLESLFFLVITSHIRPCCCFINSIVIVFKANFTQLLYFST